MFFFIAGIQPKTVKIENRPRRCPSCGLHKAILKRTDHYLSLFFLPLFRVQKGAYFVECQGCGVVSAESDGAIYDNATDMPRKCSNCGTKVDKAFKFCPYCGNRL